MAQAIPEAVCLPVIHESHKTKIGTTENTKTHISEITDLTGNLFFPSLRGSPT